MTRETLLVAVLWMGVVLVLVSSSLTVATPISAARNHGGRSRLDSHSPS